MKVSMKVDYGVRVLVDLAQHYGQGSVHTTDIASRQAIPEPYLDQLLTVLRKAGFISSKRGPQGGHILAKIPADINLGELISSLEGSTAPTECVDEPARCVRSTLCVQRDVWRAVEEATQKLLQGVTIDELAQQEQRQEAAVYHI